MLDGDAMNRQNPSTFPIPSLASKQCIALGHWVKIGINIDDNETPGERIWVRVTGGDGSAFTGRVISHLAFPETYGVYPRDVIHFALRHVLDTVVKRPALVSLDQVVSLPKDPAEGVHLDDTEFEIIDATTLPENLVAHILGDGLPEMKVMKTGGNLIAEVGESLNAQSWLGPYNVHFFAKTMVNAAKLIMLDGGQVKEPRFEKEGESDFRVSWKMEFPVTLAPQLLLDAVKDMADAIYDRALEMLP